MIYAHWYVLVNCVVTLKKAFCDSPREPKRSLLAYGLNLITSLIEVTLGPGYEFGGAGPHRQTRVRPACMIDSFSHWRTVLWRSHGGAYETGIAMGTSKAVSS